MSIYTLGQLTAAQLQELAVVDDRGTVSALWEKGEAGGLTEEEQNGLRVVRRSLMSYRSHLVNEATIWSRAIYPLLVLAERDQIRAYAEVPLQASLPHGELRGEVDGALAHMAFDAEASPPYVLIVEAKRGVAGNDPVAQLFGGLLCAAWQNHRRKPQGEQRLYGAYTIADVWTFVQVTVSGLDTPGERPTLITTSSREYAEKTEAPIILALLKSMVGELSR